MLATVPMTLAFNLDISYLFFLPAFIVFAIASIVNQAPSAYIVKQIDYIVWKTIFLFLNLGLLSLAIWRPLITPTVPSD